MNSMVVVVIIVVVLCYLLLAYLVDHVNLHAAFAAASAWAAVRRA